MNTRTKLFALTLSALAAGASLAQSGEARYIEGKPFQSTRTRLEVHSEAVEANRNHANKLSESAHF
jgi:hypothetical protein